MIVNFIKVSDVSVFVPCIVSSAEKVPDIESSFKINSVVFTPAILNVLTVSTIALASDVTPVIVLPIKSVGSPTVAIALNIFLLSNFPSDILSICSLG